MKFKLTGMRFFTEDDGRNRFKMLAHGDVEFTDIGVTICNAVLAWSAERGYTALAPMAKIGRGGKAVIWYADSPFARELADRMIAMFAAMGGELPDLPEDDEPDEPARRDHVTGKPIGPDPFDAVDETMERAGLDRVLGAHAQIAA